MRPLIKYPSTLLILLMIGYFQLFIPTFQGRVPGTSIKNPKDTKQLQALAIKKAEVETIYIEEKEEKEEENISFRKHAEYASAFSYAQVQEYSSQPIKRHSAFLRDFSSFTFLRPHYLVFGVFRL